MQIKRQLTPYMHQSLPSLLFPEYRRRVLGLLLLRPDEALHGREIARRTGLPAGTITRELGKLADVGLLKREKRGNQQVYSANTTGPIYTELASILRKTSGLADVLVQALAPAAPQLRVAFVFGSVAQGRETAGSDIDVMLIGELSFRHAVELLHPTQAVLGREVNPKVFAPKEFMTKVRNEPFLVDVLAKPKLFLIGNAHDLEELAGHQP
jgi:predicted nucleotidyltransferase